MRSWQKLVRNGNTTHVAITRSLLTHLGWLPGQLVAVELLEDNSLRIYRFDQHGENAKGQLPKAEPEAAPAR